MLCVRACLLLTLLMCPAAVADSVHQSARRIPVVRKVDLVVVGGSLGAVAAAAEAATEGASVLLIGSRPYLGEDLCATMHLWVDEDDALDGELTSRIFSDSHVTTPIRVKQTLETVKRTCLNETVGAVSFASRDGTQELTTYGIFPPETLILGMTYMYKGDMAIGMKVCFDCMKNMVLRQGKEWDMTNMVNADTGEVRFGTDYYQMMMLWAVPAAIDGQGIREFCAAGGFVDRIIEAGKDLM